MTRALHSPDEGRSHGTLPRVLATLVLILVVPLGSVACASGAKREAASLAAAVERYRRAGNSDKRTEANLLAAVFCADREVCDAKTACVAVSEPTSKGLGLKSEVERGMADLEAKRITPESPAAQELAQKLEDASRLLERGRAALASCDEKILNLRLKYGN